MGRKKAEHYGLGSGLWVRLPHLQEYQVRQLTRKRRPLGTVLRELVLAGLELERQELALKKAQAKAHREAKASVPSPPPTESSST